MNAISLQLLQEFWCLEVLRDWFVVSGDDFVDLFLPAWLGIFAGLNWVEELSKGNIEDWQKVLGDLNVVVSVVVDVENAVQFGLFANMDFWIALDAFADRLTSILLHLDVIELSLT